MLVALLYGFVINFIVLSNGNHEVCEWHLEIQKNSLLYSRGWERECVFEVLVSKGDVSSCSEIMKYPDYCPNCGRGIDQCVKFIAVSSLDAGSCELIKNVESKAFCYQGIAEGARNISYCEKVRAYGGYWEICKMNVAALINDPTVCDEFKNKEYKYQCFLTIAQGNLDYSICEIYFPKEEEAVSQEEWGVYTVSIEKCKDQVDLVRGLR